MRSDCGPNYAFTTPQVASFNQNTKHITEIANPSFDCLSEFSKVLFLE